LVVKGRARVIPIGSRGSAIAVSGQIQELDRAIGALNQLKGPLDQAAHVAFGDRHVRLDVARWPQLGQQYRRLGGIASGAPRP
jgi:hypothetical protein